VSVVRIDADWTESDIAAGLRCHRWRRCTRRLALAAGWAGVVSGLLVTGAGVLAGGAWGAYHVLAHVHMPAMPVVSHSNLLVAGAVVGAGILGGLLGGRARALAWMLLAAAGAVAVHLLLPHLTATLGGLMGTVTGGLSNAEGLGGMGVMP